MESVIGGTFATFGNRLLYQDERLCLFKCINTQNHDLGQVKTGLTVSGLDHDAGPSYKHCCLLNRTWYKEGN